MIFDEEKSEFILSDGSRFYANLGILGIGEDNEGRICNGLDGGTEPPKKHEEDWNPQWTKEHREEIADYMIALWTKWRGGEVMEKEDWSPYKTVNGVAVYCPDFIKFKGRQHAEMEVFQKIWDKLCEIERKVGDGRKN